MLSLIKLSRSLPDSVVLLRRGFQIEAGAAFFLIFHRIARRNFALQLRRLAEVRRHRRRLQRRAPLPPRRKVLSYRLSRRRGSQSDLLQSVHNSIVMLSEAKHLGL